jgi:hypothetical protein
VIRSPSFKVLSSIPLQPIQTFHNGSNSHAQKASSYHDRVQRQSNLSSQSISFIKTRIPGRLQAQLMRNSFSFMKNRKLIIRLSILLLPHTVSPFMNISGLSVSRFSLAQCITCAIVKLALGDRGTSASTDFLFPNNNSIPPLQISKHELKHHVNYSRILRASCRLYIRVCNYLNSILTLTILKYLLGFKGIPFEHVMCACFTST